MIELHLDGISDELKLCHRWVLSAIADVRQPDGTIRKDCKPPFNAKTGYPASHSDPSTWSTFDEAVKAHRDQMQLHESKNIVAIHPEVWRGIGCVIGPPFFAIDIDCCRNPETGVIEPWALEFLRELSSYTEVSPSGTGVHVWLHGEAPYPQGHHKDDVEIYSSKRFLTVTGVEVTL